jgi:methionine-gamma-lyase
MCFLCVLALASDASTRGQVRGLKTFPLRMARHCESGARVGAFLAAHPAVASVAYCGLPDHPDHAMANALFTPGRGYSGMLSFEVRGGVAAGCAFVGALQLVNLAVSLGSVESLCEHPASMTHAMVPAQARAEGGITDGLVRLSVGYVKARRLCTPGRFLNGKHKQRSLVCPNAQN